MLGVKLHDVDEVYRLYLNLEIITYMEELIRWDDCRDRIAYEAAVYLLDRQVEVMEELKAVLDSEEFGVPLGNGER